MPAVAPSSALSTSWTGAWRRRTRSSSKCLGMWSTAVTSRSSSAWSTSASVASYRTTLNCFPAISRWTSPVDTVVRSSSTTSIATRFTSKVAALASTRSCTTGIMKIWNTVVRSRKIWRNSFRTRKKMVRTGQPSRIARPRDPLASRKSVMPNRIRVSCHRVASPAPLIMMPRTMVRNQRAGTR